MKTLRIMGVVIGFLLLMPATTRAQATPTPSFVGAGNTGYYYQHSILTSNSVGLVVKFPATQQTTQSYSCKSIASNTTNALCDWFPGGTPPASPSGNALELAPGDSIGDGTSTYFGPTWMGLECWLKAGSTPPHYELPMALTSKTRGDQMKSLTTLCFGLILLLLPQLANAQNIHPNFFNGGTTLTATCTNISGSLTSSDVFLGTAQGNTTVTLPAASVGCLDYDVIDLRFTAASGSAFTLTVNGGTGTATKVISNGGALLPAPTGVAGGVNILHQIWVYDAVASTPQWELATQETQPAQTVAFNAGSIQTYTNEVAYAGNGVATSFSGYVVLHPLVSIDTTNGGNVTVNWTHATVANNQTVSTTGTFAANSDLSSGSITNAGALTLTFLSGHAPDNGTNVTITYTRGIQCNEGGTGHECDFTCDVSVAGGKWTLFNPINLPSIGGALDFVVTQPSFSCYGGVTFDTNFYGPQNNSGFALASIAGTGQPYAPWANCFLVGNNGKPGDSTRVLASTDGTKVVIDQCGVQGPTFAANNQMSVGDFYGAEFFHTVLAFQGGGSVHTCGSTANCASGSLGACTAGAVNEVGGITDSTPITIEGQPCAGNSSGNALVYCDGVSWKCFSALASTKGYPFASTTVSVTAPTAVGCTDQTVSVTNVTTAMSVHVTPQTNPNGTSGAVTWDGYVSAAGTVDVRVCTAVAETSPPATTYNVIVGN